MPIPQKAGTSGTSSDLVRPRTGRTILFCNESQNYRNWYKTGRSLRIPESLITVEGFSRSRLAAAATASGLKAIRFLWYTVVSSIDPSGGWCHPLGSIPGHTR